MADILTFNNSWLRVGSGLLNNEIPPVAAKTIRFRFSNTSFDPRTDTVPYSSDYDYTWTKVADGIYDFMYDHAEWLYTTRGSSQQYSIIGAVRSPSNINTKPLDTAATVGTLEVIDSNLSGVTKMGNFGNNLQHTIVSAKLRNVSNLTTASKLFQNTSNLATVDMGELSSASSLSSMFDGCTSLTGVNISAPVATSSSAMFRSCTSLTSATVSAPSVTNSKDMFKSCTSLTSATVDLTSATTTEGLFYGCSSLTNATVQTSSVLANIKSMFQLCSSLTSVPSIYTANATNMTSMLAGCSSLTNVTLDCTSATTTESMFDGCTSLTSVSLQTSSALTNTANMFKNCKALVTAPNFTTTSTTRMDGMFEGCTALTSIPQLTTSSLTNVSKMFNGCSNVASGALALYNQMSTQTNPPTTKSNCFYNCGSGTSGLADLEQIPYSWGGKMLDMSVVSTSWVKSHSSGASYGWTSTDSDMKFQLWAETSYGDRVTIRSMTVYSSASLSQYAGISMRRSAIAESYGTFNSALGNALNFYLAIYQVLDNSYLSIAALSPLYGSLGANEDEIDMPGTVASMTMSSAPDSRCDHTLGWRLGFIVFNDLPNSSNFGILYNNYFNTNPDLYCTAVDPTSAFRY